MTAAQGAGSDASKGIITTADIPCRCEHCQRARSHRATLQSTSDGSGSLPPDDPGPSPTPAVGFIVTLTEPLQLTAGAQLWVRRESWGDLGVDVRHGGWGASWTPVREPAAFVEVAP